MGRLEDVRGRIRELDTELVDLVAARVEAARDAGRVKRQAHIALRDYATEREVVTRVREGFDAKGLDPDLGERLAQLLITESLRVQEEDGLEPGEGPRGKALVIGGRGKMGRWFAHFFNDLGHEVLVHDVAGDAPGFASVPNARKAADDCELVVVSTPPAATRDVLASLEGVDALVFDISSLKGPFVGDLRRLARRQRVASVHPLWGPRTRVLSGKNVLVLDCGNADAASEARALFGLTAANVVMLPLEAHDPLMALTLGLPHALNLAYAEVLCASGQSLATLHDLGGPTFLSQTDVAAEVASENPELYRQIQLLNTDSPRIYQELHDAIDRLGERSRDPGAFTRAMEGYQRYFGDARRPRP